MNDSEIVEGLRGEGARQTRAITYLYRTYGRPFTRYFQKHGVDRSEAEDLLQEVFINVVKYGGSFRNDCTVKIWLWKIARNTMLSHFRKKRPEMLDIDDDHLSEGVWCSREGVEPTLEDCVKQAFEKFRCDYLEHAQALFLATIEGWNSTELADFLERTPAATREYISQCRKKMQPYIDPCREYL